MADKGSFAAYKAEMQNEIKPNTTQSTTSQQIQDNLTDLADTAAGVINTEVATLEAADAALDADITTNTASIASLSSTVSGHTTSIATNASGISANAADIATNAADIATVTASVNKALARPATTIWVHEYGTNEAAINSAIAAANATTGRVRLMFDKREWAITGTKTITNSVVMEFVDGAVLNINFSRDALAPGSQSNGGFNFEGSIGSYRALSANVARGDMSISNATLAGEVVAGDWVYIRSADALTEVEPHLYGSYPSTAATHPGELHQVKSVSSPVVYLCDPIQDAMTTANTAEAAKLTPLDGVGIVNCRTKAGTNLTLTCVFKECVNVLVKNVIRPKNHSGGFRYNRCANVLVENDRDYGAYQNGYYGHIICGTNLWVWRGGEMYSASHAITTSAVETSGANGEIRRGTPIRTRIHDVDSHANQWAAFDSHAEGRDMWFVNCNAYVNSVGDVYAPGFQFRARTTKCSNCHVFGNFGVNTNTSSAGFKVYGPDCHLFNCTSTGMRQGIHLAPQSSGFFGLRFIAQGGVYHRNVQEGIRLDGNGALLMGVAIIDNGIGAGGNDFLGLVLHNDSGHRIFNCYIPRSSNQTYSVKLGSTGNMNSQFRGNYLDGFTVNSNTGFFNVNDHATIAGYNHVF